MLLQKGSSGSNVTYLQYGLHIMCFSTGGFDGIFGDGTYNAAKRFQSAYGLSADGIVGDGTWNKLCSEIRSIQNQLNNKGFNVGAADGVAGSNTYNGVLSFQRANGLSADGQVGSATRSKLFSSSSGSGSGYSRLLTVTSPLMYGDDIRAVQNKLNALGYNAGATDGYYGDGTRNAVVRFQSAKGLSADGQVGPATWNAIFNTSSIPDITQKLRDLMVRYEYMFSPELNGYAMSATKLLKFYEIVDNNAIIDLKRRGWNEPQYIFDGTIYRTDAPGNILYGYMGKVFGIHDEFLLTAAGIVNAKDYIKNNKKLPPKEWITKYYGDDPYDAMCIKVGIKYFNTHH